MSNYFLQEESDQSGQCKEIALDDQSSRDETGFIRAHKKGTAEDKSDELE